MRAAEAMEPQTAAEAAHAAAARLATRTDELGRKIWDKDFFARKAQLRQFENGEDPGVDFLNEECEGGLKPKKRTAIPPVERQPLQQRKDPIHLDDELGKMKIITAATPKQQQGGYWCEVCECLIKDSQAYLDHLNGKKHNRLLGMSMTVERVGLDAVVQRLQQAKIMKQKQKEAAENGDRDDLYASVASRIDAAEKEQRKKKKKDKKKRKKQSEQYLQGNHSDLDPELVQFFSVADNAVVESEKSDSVVAEGTSQPPRDSRFDVPPTSEVSPSCNDDCTAVKRAKTVT